MQEVRCEYRQCRCCRSDDPVVAVSYARTCEHARGRSTSLWTDCTVKRGGDGGNKVVRFALGAVALATVKVVSALVGPHTTVD